MDFNKPATALEREIRALNPWPGTWFEIAGERIKVAACAVVDGITADPGHVVDDHLTIACAEGAIRPLTLQRPGKGMMDAEAFLRGYPVPIGTMIKP